LTSFRSNKQFLVAIVALLFLGAGTASAEQANCPGAGNTAQPVGSSSGSSGGSGSGDSAMEKIINGMCWNCILPVSIGPIEFGSGWEYPDSNNPGTQYWCSCGWGEFAYYGTEFGWWEPGYLVDVVRQKGCAYGLNGEKLDVDSSGGSSGSGSGSGGSSGGSGSSAASSIGDLFTELKKFGVHAPNEGPAESQMKEGFYNTHIYQNYVMSWFQDEMDDECVIQDSEFTTYFSELDDGWNNDYDAALWAPDSLIYGNIIAQMACAGDCAVANVSTASDSMTWCAGCQGSVFPLSGRVPNQVGGVQASVLLLERMLYKVARMGQFKATHAHFGAYSIIHGYCQQSNEFMLHKQHYKYQIYAPRDSNSSPKIGGCCYPYGRSTTFVEMMREYPSGEDWLHGLWQKRHCCLG